MAGQGTTSTSITAILKTYYDKRFIERLEPKTYLYQFATKRPIPSGIGKTAEFTGYRGMKPITGNSGELASTQTYLSAYTITATLIQRHNYVQFSTLLKDTSIDPKIQGAVDVLSDQMAKTVELYMRQVVVGLVGCANRTSTANMEINTAASYYNNQGTVTGPSSQRTHHFYSPFPCLHNKTRLSSSGADIAVMAGSAASLNQIRHAVSFLRSRDVDPMDDGDFIFYCHPWTADNFMKDPQWKTWNSPQNAKTTMYRGEVGNAYGARIVVSNMAFRYVYSAAPLTTASGAFNASFIFGKGAFACTEIANGQPDRGFEIFVKTPGPNSTNDPTNLINTVGAKMTMVAVVLNKSAGACVINTDRVVSSAT